MTHAWLITGPPGSGRSNAARAFAAALQCPDGGCGHCHACTTALSGNHADVHIVATEKVSIAIDEVRQLVQLAHRSPAPVSYTHLRAHETRHDLVCRLLLEKKK